MKEATERERQEVSLCQVEAVARITALEQERVELIAQVQGVMARLNQVEQDQEARSRDLDRAPTTQPAETTRGFEQVGSAWRFAVGSSYLEVSDNGIQVRSAGDLTVTSSQGMDLTSGMDLRLSPGMNLVAGAGLGVQLTAGTEVDLQSGGSERLRLLSANAQLTGTQVILGALGELQPAAGVGSTVQTPLGGGAGTILTGSNRVFIGN